MNWVPDFERSSFHIKAKPSGHPIFEERLQNWREFLDDYGFLPSVLLCDDGFMVNGHHRLIVAREQEFPLFGLIVYNKDGHWICTGNLCRVL